MKSKNDISDPIYSYACIYTTKYLQTNLICKRSSFHIFLNIREMHRPHAFSPPPRGQLGHVSEMEAMSVRKAIMNRKTRIKRITFPGEVESQRGWDQACGKKCRWYRHHFWAVSLNGGKTPISHPKCWSFLVGKPMGLLGKPTISGNLHMNHGNPQRYLPF